MDFDKFSLLAFCGYFAFISIRKEAIKIIQMYSKSRNDALSSDKNFPFRKLITCCGYFAFISIKKVAIKITQTDSKSRNDALSSDKIFLFRKLITCQPQFINVIMWPKKAANPILKGCEKCGRSYLNGIWKMQPALSLWKLQKSGWMPLYLSQWAMCSVVKWMHWVWLKKI